jgi:outer membrane receptor protein involved in Fe transport
MLAGSLSIQSIMLHRSSVLAALLRNLFRDQRRALWLAPLMGELLCLAHPAAAQEQAAPARPAAIVKPGQPVRKDETPQPPAVAAPAEPEPAPGATVMVTAERPTNRIDRQVYDVKADVGASIGSAADALNNVPSVAVDPDGTLSLRGSQHVTILVDGKPSAMFQGDNRGAALNALPADDIESVEVINNPGAQFGNEAGGGPIINIVMRRSRKPGGFGVVNANDGTAGRHNGGASGTYNTGRLGLQGGVNYRRDGRDSVAADERVRVDANTGTVSRSTQASASQGLNDALGLNAALSYNLGDTDTLATNLAYNHRSNDQVSADRYVGFGSDDVADSDYLRSTRRSGVSDNASWGARFDRKGEIPGELIRFDLRVSASVNDGANAFANAYSLRPVNARDSRSRQDNHSANRIFDFTGDYERPNERGVLKLGYKIARNKNSFDTRYTDIDLATQAETLNAIRSNSFDVIEANLAVYGSYQLRLNENWGVLGGLRAEYTKLAIDQLTSAIGADNAYLNTIPSFFVTYKATEDANLRFSYAHRIRRPGSGDLNPFVVYRDELNVSSGNPYLKPTQSDSYELGYETRFGGMETNLRGYFRKDHDLISERRYFISDTVLLTTRDNAGSNKSGGLEFTLNGRLLPDLTLNTSGNLGYNQQTILDPYGLGATTRSARSLSGRARLNYKLSDADQLQLALNAQGKTLNGQGYRQPNSTTNLSLRHNLSPAFSLVMNVTDVFNKNKIETITETPLLSETNVRRFDGRVVYLGLSYRLGGAGMGAGRRGGGGFRG